MRLLKGKTSLARASRPRGGLTAVGQKALAQVSNLRGQLVKARAAAKDNVADLSKPAAGLAGAALAGAIRGFAFTSENGVVIERRLGGVVPWDVVASSAMAVGGLVFAPNEAGRLVTHMGMGGLCGRLFVGVGDAVGSHRLGEAWTGGQPVEVIETVEPESAE